MTPQHQSRGRASPNSQRQARAEKQRERDDARKAFLAERRRLKREAQRQKKAAAAAAAATTTSDGNASGGAADDETVVEIMFETAAVPVAAAREGNDRLLGPDDYVAIVTDEGDEFVIPRAIAERSGAWSAILAIEASAAGQGASQHAPPSDDENRFVPTPTTATGDVLPEAGRVGSASIRRLRLPDFSSHNVERVIEFLIMDAAANREADNAMTKRHSPSRASGRGDEFVRASGTRVVFQFALDETVMELLALGHFLNIPPLVEMCTRMLSEHIVDLIPALDGFPPDVMEHMVSVLPPDKLLAFEEAYFEHFGRDAVLPVSTDEAWRGRCDARLFYLNEHRNVEENVYYCVPPIKFESYRAFDAPPLCTGAETIDYRRLFVDRCLQVNTLKLFHAAEPLSRRDERNLAELLFFADKGAHLCRSLIFSGTVCDLVDAPSYLGAFSALDYLDLSSTEFRPEQLEIIVDFLVGHHHVSRVGMGNVSVHTARPFVALLAAADPVGVEDLNMYASSLTRCGQDVAALIRAQPSITTLDLTRTRVELDAVIRDGLDGNTTVRKLVVGGNYVWPSKDWAGFASSAVEYFSLEEADVTAEQSAHWSFPPTLATLDLSRSESEANFTDSILPALQQARPSLRAVNFYGTAMTFGTAAVQTLMSEFELEWLGLSHTRLAAAGFGNILDGVRACATLRVLKADAATIFVRSIPLIIEVIEDSPCLEEMSLLDVTWEFGEDAEVESLTAELNGLAAAAEAAGVLLHLDTGTGSRAERPLPVDN